MLRSTLLFILVLQCCLGANSADGKLGDIHIYCRWSSRLPSPRDTQISDCYDALNLMKYAHPQRGVFRDLLNRQLRTPGRMDRAVDSQSFRLTGLPAEFVSGSCEISLTYYREADQVPLRLTSRGPRIIPPFNDWLILYQGIEGVIPKCLEGNRHASGNGVLIGAQGNKTCVYIFRVQWFE
jgi:hypothetical protein